MTARHAAAGNRGIRRVRRCASGAAGFSLVELMVGIAVSLIGTLAMLSVFARFEVQKRRTTAGNDAQENGSFAAYELERVLRSAGSGVVQGKNYALPGCTLQATLGGTARLPHGGRFPAPFDAFPAAMQAIPVLVQSGGGAATATNPDTLAVIAGDSSLRVFQAAVQAGTTPRSLVLDNGIGIAPGDYVLGAPNAGGCLLSVLGATSTSLPPTYAVAPGDAAGNGFVGTSNVFDLGPQPIVALYGVNTAATPNVLTRFDALSGVQDSVADGIVMLKALYGVDDGASSADIAGSGTADDDVIDEWVRPVGAWDSSALMAGTPAARKAIGQIKAVRIAIVAQSELPERASDYSGPETLDLFADAGALKYTLRTSPQFRYKVYDTTIPIRNALITRFF